MNAILDTILDIRNLTFVFPNHKGIFDISLQINRGEVYYLYGGHGSGKTLFLQAILGALPSHTGMINLFGERIDLKGTSRIGYMPKQPKFMDRMNINETLQYFSFLTGSVERNFDKILNMDTTEKKPLNKLPIYTQKLVSLGIALLGNPDILLLDEPFQGLDVEEAGKFSSLISLLNKDKAITFLITGQNYDLASTICSRYGVFRKGRLIAQFTHKELEEHCKKCIRIKTPDIIKAIPILQKEFPQFEVLNDEVLRVFCPLHDSARINKELILAGVEVSEIWIAGINPKEYLSDLAGGAYDD